MKKILAIILSTIMLFSLTSISFGATIENEKISVEIEDYINHLKDIIEDDNNNFFIKLIAKLVIFGIKFGLIKTTDFEDWLTWINTLNPPSDEQTTILPEEPTNEESLTSEDKETTEDSLYDSLPNQIKTYMSGNFYIEGYYNDEKIATSRENTKASIIINNNTYDLILSNNSKKHYAVDNNRMLYCDLNDFILDLINININPYLIEHNIMSAETTQIEIDKHTENSIEYIVYNLKSDNSKCEIYCINNDIKKIHLFDKDSNIKNILLVTFFDESSHKSEFSIKGYKYTTALKFFESIFGGFVDEVSTNFG